MKGRATRAAAVAMAGLLAASCGGGDDDEPTVPTTAAADPVPTTTADPYAVPPVIDAAYVNKVLEGLDAAVGDVVRIVIRTRDIPPEVIDRLNAIYLDREEINLKLASLQDDLRSGFASYQLVPGNKRSLVEEVLSASRACVYVRVVRDYTAVGNKADLQPSVEWVGLKPRLKPGDSTRDPGRHNPTPWMVASEGVLSDGSQPPSPCPGS